MPLVDWLWCGAAGVIGSLGFLALYSALADGQMSIAAPIAAVTSAGVPAIVGTIRDGIPPALTLTGFLFALIAIWLIAQSGQNTAAIKLKDMLLPFLAGLRFGIYFIFIAQGGQTSLLAPLVVVRGAGGLTLFIVATLNKELHLPTRPILPMGILISAPIWAAWPFETLLVAHRPGLSRLTELTSAETSSLAEIMKDITTRYNNLFEISFPYSMGFHQAPFDGQTHSEWIFHVHFYPPLLRSANVSKFMVGYEILAIPYCQK